MQANMELEPMMQNQIYETLVQLEATIVAPNALQQFHSTHKLVEQHSGETVTFLLSLGLRDVMATQAWGMLTNLCGNAAAKLIGLRIRPMRMERQPIVKVLAERFPPAPKGKGKGKMRDSTSGVAETWKACGHSPCESKQSVLYECEL